MIFLNRDDILKCINYKEMMESIEDAYKAYAAENYSMPLRMSEEMGENKDTLLLMPCVNGNGFGTKILTLFPKNIEKNKPYIDGIMVLHDKEVGETTAVMDAKILTALRTGAVGGVAIKHLSREDIDSVGIIGCGIQGFYQAIYAATARKLKNINIFDQRTEVLEEFANKLSKEVHSDIKINICRTSEELVRNSQVIVTATTSTDPVIPDDVDLIKNKCFIGIGSYKPFMREYSKSVIKHCDKIYIDTDHAFHETGDLIIPLEQDWITKEKINMFSDIVLSNDYSKSDTVFFKSVGMALFDLFVAQKIFDVATKNDIGQKVNF